MPRREQFPVDKSRTGKAFSMNQMRGLYNCSRVPGEVRDKLVRFFKTGTDNNIRQESNSKSWLLFTNALKDLAHCLPVCLLISLHVLAFVHQQIKPDLLNTKFSSALYNLLLKSFAFEAPQLWNSLPTHLRSATSLQMFKKGFKFYLFSVCHILL